MIVTGSKLVLAAGAVNSAVLLLASADHKHPRGVPNSSDQVGRNRMIHNRRTSSPYDVNRHNDVTFRKTLSINDFESGAYPAQLTPVARLDHKQQLRRSC